MDVVLILYPATVGAQVYRGLWLYGCISLCIHEISIWHSILISNYGCKLACCYWTKTLEDTAMAQCLLPWWSPETVPAEAGQAL